MAKDPAFLWYPNDYIGGTMGMTKEEKGAYVDLLMMQFNIGHMPEHMCEQTCDKSTLLWHKVRHKFVQDEDGKWYNVRLEEEKNKRKNYVNSRRENSLRKNKKTNKKKKHMNNHMYEHTENENINKNINNNSNKVVTFKKPKVIEVVEYFREKGHESEAEIFYDFYESKGWMVGKNKMKSWKSAANNWMRRNYGQRNSGNSQQITPKTGKYSSLPSVRERNNSHDDA